MYQQEILKLISKLIEKENVNLKKLMHYIIYTGGEFICKCQKDIFSIKKRKVTDKKKRKVTKRKAGKILFYPPNPDPDIKAMSKTFRIKYEKKLSSIAKSLLNSFQDKYLYYAIDDILDLLKSNPIERDNLLTVLYSPVLSLHNNLSIDFFDIWIQEIYISEVSKVNKFLTNPYQTFESFSYITIKFLYQTKPPVKKPESLW